MSGYAALALLAILTIAVIPSMYLLWHSCVLATSGLGNGVVEVIRSEVLKAGYAVEINASSATWENPFTLSFWVANVGSASIPVKDLPYIDVIVVFNSTSTGGRIAMWVPYDPRGSPGKDVFWDVEGVRVAGADTEVVNPIRPRPSGPGTAPESGMWDPGEELKFVVYFTPKLAPDTSAPLTVIVVVRSGSCDVFTGVVSS